MTAASASKTKPKVLFVDDEVNILHGLKRQLHRSFEMDLADTVDQAFEFIEKSGPYMAVVSDMRMPDLSGTEFLKQVASAAPNTVRLMLTGNADQKTAVDAVNEAGVFRFLTKPCSKEEMTEALNAAVKRYQTNTAEQLLLKKTLVGSMDLMTSILSIANPELFGRIANMKKRIKSLAEALNVADSWSLEVAAIFSQVMIISLPADIREKLVKDTPLQDEELEILQTLPERYRKLVGKIPRMEPVADTLYFSLKNFDGSSVPIGNIAGKKIPASARILHILSDLQERQIYTGKAEITVLSEMREETNKYDKELVERLRTLAILDSQNQPMVEKEIPAYSLEPGQFIISDLRTINGRLLLLGGQQMSETQLNLISSYIANGTVAEPIKIAVPK